MAKAKCHKCEEKCGKGKVHPEILEKLEIGFKNFYKSGSKSLLKKYLTREVFDKLKTKKTSFDSSLLDCVQSGFANPDSNVGIYAADPECYTIFADIFDPIIQDYHLGFKNPTYNQLRIMGKYYPLSEMTPDEQQKLVDDHLLFKEGDRFLQAANSCRYWPNGRGIFYNDDKTFLVWVNEEDHLRIISLQQGGNLGEVYKRFVTALIELEKKIPFIKSERLGNLTFCPTNLGTAIRASIHVRLPKLAANMTRFEELADKFNLQVRGTRGEHSEAEGGIYDVSNKRRLGLTEFNAIKEMYEGVTELIKQERAA
ncbi:hypothetical protein NQ318_008693 [Aromia moschata]|uniref:arginine kinase n=1 Tax=Aromia moschata TaxID=1265417 RepID=A0AAV8X6D4_9CUCU|nr:hypothetical protein NQ318_008693 [Aromia moschata]